MIRNSKQSDERREAGPLECWCLHGSVGLAADWRDLGQRLAERGISTRAVDLWRFLECCPMPIADFGRAFNADAGGEAKRGGKRVLAGYSMGGRLALHALLEKNHPWQAAIIIGAHPGLETAAERSMRLAADADWAGRALMDKWSDFLESWESQPVLAGTDKRDARDASRLQLRRREIARSFVDWSLGNQLPLSDRLPEIDIPLLWVVGEQDTKFLALAESATAAMPNAQLAIAPNCGHRVPWLAQDWLAQQIQRFLA